MWYYMDSTGQEFGPYPSSTMKGWFKQNFFPMQGELQVRLDDMPPDQHYYIKDLYPHPIMERAFDGEPNLPTDSRNRGRGNRGGGGGRNAAPQPMAMENPYDSAMGLGGGAALWAMPGMPGMMGAGAMQSPGMAPFGFPPMRPGMMPGMPGMPGMSMPMMPGPGMSPGRFQGRIKSFNVQKGFGFIECAEAHQIYGRDVFLHKAQISNFQIGSQLTFAVEMNKNNMPQARDLLECDMMGGFPGGPMGGMGFPGMGAPTSKGGYNNPKGGGKGKGGGGKGSKPKAAAKGGDQKKSGGGEKKSGGAGGSPKEPAPAPAPDAA
jgi:cold shock CspA family protein